MHYVTNLFVSSLLCSFRLGKIEEVSYVRIGISIVNDRLQE